MCKVAIMQPYFLPYNLYFDLIRSVDKFVFLTDVQYIRRGWVNKNYVKNRHKIQIPVKKASREEIIRNIKVCSWQDKLLKNILYLYGKKDHPILDFIKKLNIDSLSDINISLIKECCRYLKINSEFIDSYDLNIKTKGVDRIVDICKIFGAKEYVNLPGGSKIYSQEIFGDIRLTILSESPSLSILHNLLI